jgi:hypothetical protein
MAERKDVLINRPHSLYYNGELIGIITNPDPYGHVADICEALSPDQGMADAVSIPTASRLNSIAWGYFTQAVEKLGDED